MDSPSLISRVGKWIKGQFAALLNRYKVWVVIGAGIIIWWAVNKYARYRKRQERKEQINRRCLNIPESETIFVSVASYRDPQCAYTLFDLFEKAACPFRIHVGVLEQNHPVEDKPTMKTYKRLVQTRNGVHDFSTHVRVMTIPHTDAQGPVYARALIEKNLYRGEKYYMIIDSHTLFTPNWDQQCIEKWRTCRQWSSKPILTTYPHDFKAYDRVWGKNSHADGPTTNTDIGTFLRFRNFHPETQMVEIEGPSFRRPPPCPQLGLFWAACFSFGLADQIQHVPYDPFLSFVFNGEEIGMAARLWTSGYDFFHPETMIIYHMWSRQNRPTFWELLQPQQHDDLRTAHRQQQEQEGYKRLYALLGIGHTQSTLLPPYTLGGVRTLQQYESFTGIRLGAQQFTHLGGILGVPPTSKYSEILNRYGSWSEYKQLLSYIQYYIRKLQKERHSNQGGGAVIYKQVDPQ